MKKCVFLFSAIIMIAVFGLSSNYLKVKNEFLADNDPVVINPIPNTSGPVIIITMPLPLGLQQEKMI